MVVFVSGLLLFLLPGYVLASWLHRVDRLDLATRLVLGATWSFAVFSVPAAPFLWLHGSVPAFLTVAGGMWVAFCLVTGALYWRMRRSSNKLPEPLPREKPEPSGQPRRPRASRWSYLLVIAFGTMAGIVVYLWVRAENWTIGDKATAIGGHALLTLLLPAVLLTGSAVAVALERSTGDLLRFGPDDDALPPRIWSAAAAALILFQAVGVVTYGRPDWDDCFYLAAALDYQEGSVLNDQEPTHREGYPVQPIYWLMIWELWGATLGRMSGIGPLVTFHSLLPGLLVLACYAAYRAVLQELLPRRWVPLALIGLGGFHLWGISNLGNASNHFLIRIWQGKAVLLHFCIPIVMCCLLRFSRDAALRWWLSLCAALLIGPGLSSSAIFLSTFLIACLVPVVIGTVPAGRRLAFVVGSFAALLPTVGVGVLTWLNIRGDSAYVPETSQTSWQRWFFEWDRYSGRGSAEVVWITLLPLLFVMLRDWRSRAVLLGLPAVLVLVFGNPLIANLVASRLTGAVTYSRLFWLYPVGLGLAAILALGSRLVARLLNAASGANVSGSAFATCLCGLAVSAALPGVWVWGAANSRDAFMTPGPADNLEHMPADLKVIADRLAGRSDIAERRIACGEEVASFLTPYDRRFRFVCTRDGYTMYSVGRAHGPAEAAERLYLAAALQRGRLSPPLPEAGWDLIVRISGADADAARPDPWPSRAVVPELLARYNVGYAIASPISGRSVEESQRLEVVRDAGLREYGFHPLHKGNQYCLWAREPRPALAR